MLLLHYRGLREARDVAMSEKERAVNAENIATAKYEQLLQELVTVISSVIHQCLLG